MIYDLKDFAELEKEVEAHAERLGNLDKLIFSHDDVIIELAKQIELNTNSMLWNKETVYNQALSIKKIGKLEERILNLEKRILLRRS